MNGKAVAVCCIIALLGIVSAVAGFAAEATKVKISEVYIKDFSCVYPNSPSLGFGILAAICTIINRTILNILVGCCCRSPSSTTATTAFSSLLNILSWITSVMGVILLLAAAKINNREGAEINPNCYVVKPGIFVVGAVLSLLNAMFGIVAYISVSSAKRMTSKPEFALLVANRVDPE